MLSAACASEQQYFGHRKYYADVSSAAYPLERMRPLRALTSPVPALFVALTAALSSASMVRGLYDPDYFWHVTTGRMVLESGRIPTTDPFSFTWHGEPWIADQWLGQALIAVIQDHLGVVVLLIGFGALAALGPALVAEAMRRDGAHIGVVLALAVLASAALLTQVTARPQVISFALMGLLLVILISIRPASRFLLVVPPLLFLVWANTHGFFIVGLSVGFVYMVTTLLGRTAMKERRLAVVAVGLLSVGAAALTPQGVEGIVYAASFGNLDDWVGQRIAEWQSPDFHDPQFLPFLLLLVTFVIYGTRGVPGWLTIVGILGLVLGLLAVRSIGIGSIMMLPAVTLSTSHRLEVSRLEVSEPARRWLEVAIATGGAAILLTYTITNYPIRAKADFLPVAGTEVLSEVRPDARVLASFGWGGYVLHELHERGGRVFVDGRMPKYRPDLMEDYDMIVNADRGWVRLVADYDVEAMLLRPSAVITKGIAQDAGWCEVYRDEVQVLLLRHCPDGSAKALTAGE
jgi:hypothetical protein